MYEKQNLNRPFTSAASRSTCDKNDEKIGVFSVMILSEIIELQLKKELCQIETNIKINQFVAFCVTQANVWNLFEIVMGAHIPASVFFLSSSS